VKHPTIPPRVRPEELVLRQFAQAAGLPFAEVLSTSQLEQVLFDCQVDYRERIFTPLVTVATFLTQVLDSDHSMRQAVARLIAYRASLQLPACSPGNRAYSKARQRLPDSFTMRELRIRVPGKSGRCREILVATTLLDARAYPKKSIAELYRQRWHAELDLRSLKTFLQMDILRCQSPAMVRKEIWVHLLAYNLLRKVMAQAAQEQQLLPRQISFKGTLQTLNAFADCLRACQPCALEGLCRCLLAAIAKQRVGNRPGRMEPRAKKRRPKPYPLLTKPRAQARKEELNGAYRSLRN
jgi:hypothetical protein